MEIKIKLKVKDVEIELSQDEAKKLAEMLADLTGGMKIIKEKEDVPYQWPWYPYQWPYYWTHTEPTPWLTTWATTNGNLCSGPYMMSLSDNVSVGYANAEPGNLK